MAKKKIKASKVKRVTRRTPKKTSLLSSIFRIPHFKLFLTIAIFGAIGLSLLSYTNTNVGKYVLGAATTANPCSGTKLIGGVCNSSKTRIYTCNGKGAATKSTICSYGCQANKGKSDSCKPTPIKTAPTPTPAHRTSTPTCTTSVTCAANQFCSQNLCLNLSCNSGYIISNHGCVRSGITPTPSLKLSVAPTLNPPTPKSITWKCNIPNTFEPKYPLSTAILSWAPPVGWTPAYYWVRYAGMWNSTQAVPSNQAPVFKVTTTTFSDTQAFWTSGENGVKFWVQACSSAGACSSSPQGGPSISTCSH